MEELKRVIFDRRFLLVLFCVFILNGILFFKMEVDEDEQILAKYQEKLYQECQEKYDTKEIVEYLKVSTLLFSQEEEQFMQNILESWDGESKVLRYIDTFLEEEQWEIRAMFALNESFEYINGYTESVQTILNRAEEQMKLSVFQSSSFAKRNIEKTSENFGELLSVSVQYGSEKAFEAVADFNISDFIILFPILTAIIIIMDERKKGLWDVVYATKNGRVHLAMNRILILAIVSFLSTSVIYAQNLMLAGICYSGYGNIFRPVQSFQVCCKVVMQINVLEFFCMVFFWKFLVLFFVGMIIMLLVLNMSSAIGVFLCVAVFFVTEYQMYDKIAPLSTFRIFKYVNVFAWLDVEYCMRTYLNLNVAGYPVGIYELMCIMVVAFFIVSCSLFLLSGNLRPKKSKDGIFVRLFRHMIFYSNHIFSMFWMEIYKQFIVRKMWIVIVVVLITSCVWCCDEKVHYDYQGTLYQTYMNLLQGEITNEKIEYLKQEISIWKEKYEEQLVLMEEGVNDFETEKKIEQYLQAIECTEDIFQYVIEMKDRKENGEQVQIVNQIAFDVCMGNGSVERHKRNAFFMLGMMIVPAALLFSSEYAENSMQMIRSTKNGRFRFICCKYITLFLEVIGIVLPVMILDFYSVLSQYQLQGFRASVHSLSFATNLADISIFSSLLLVAGMTILLLYLIAIFVTLITIKIPNVMAAEIVSMLIIALPAGLYEIGFDVAYFTFLDELTIVGWIW